MSIARGSGIPIWYDTEGEGPPLVLLHGMMGRSEAWHMDGYVDGLRDRHCVIMIDARGHGLSARPGDPADYRLRCHAADVLAVLDDLGLSSVALCGWSLGARSALWLAATAPERVSTVAALGAPREWVGFPDAPAPSATDMQGDGWAARFEREGMAWMAADLEREGHPALARLVSKADPLAMAACDRGWTWLEAAPRRLRDLPMPLLVAWGSREMRPGGPELLPPGARLVVVPDEDHFGAIGRTDVLLPELRAFFDAAVRGSNRSDAGAPSRSGSTPPGG